MATRSAILIEEKDKTYTGIYCHWDGYPEHMLPILNNYYNRVFRIYKLLNLGAISSLKKYLEPVEGTHSFYTPEDDVTIAYHRDRGDEKINAFNGNFVEVIENFKAMDCEYIYFFVKDAKCWLDLSL